jgi:hypothetical protein
LLHRPLPFDLFCWGSSGGGLAAFRLVEVREDNGVVDDELAHEELADEEELESGGEPRDGRGEGEDDEEDGGAGVASSVVFLSVSRSERQIFILHKRAFTPSVVIDVAKRPFERVGHLKTSLICELSGSASFFRFALLRLAASLHPSLFSVII